MATGNTTVQPATPAVHEDIDTLFHFLVNPNNTLDDKVEHTYAKWGEGTETSEFIIRIARALYMAQKNKRPFNGNGGQRYNQSINAHISANT